MENRVSCTMFSRLALLVALFFGVSCTAFSHPGHGPAGHVHSELVAVLLFVLALLVASRGR